MTARFYFLTAPFSQKVRSFSSKGTELLAKRYGDNSKKVRNCSKTAQKGYFLFYFESIRNTKQKAE